MSLSPYDVPNDDDHGRQIEGVVLRGGKFDGVEISLPHSVVRANLEDEKYFRTHRRSDGRAQFTHESIWGRA